MSKPPFPILHFQLFILLFFTLSLSAQNVGINTDDPTETLDIDGTLRLREGAEANFLLQSDGDGKATWVAPHAATGDYRLIVTNFGAKGDNSTDGSASIQAAIDSAGIIGAKVYFPTGVYLFRSTLIVPAGVILVGEGTGSTPTGTPYNGSMLKYEGDDWAVQFAGSSSGARDLVIYNPTSSAAKGALYLLADASGLESLQFNNVLISYFTSGTALHMEAANGGGIAYVSFYDLRIRHAQKGIHILQDKDSFVNSNSFYHGAISGGGFDYCLHVEGGNNNVFNGMVIEPYTSTFGHIVVESGQIIGLQIRIEGTAQPTNKPLIEFKEGTADSYIDGLYAGGLTIDKGDNFIKFRTGKFIEVQNLGYNLFQNASFLGIEGNDVPFWEVSGAGVTVTALPSERLPHHQVLQLDIPAGVQAYLRPSVYYRPEFSDPYLFDRCTFGAYVKTAAADFAYTSINAPGGLTVSQFHPADGDWHLVGMTGFVDKSGGLDPRFWFDNTSGASTITVYITTPTFSFGLT
ncbi:MAG: glycosyl hydrolase family 28-related protein, partial [Chitinophagales bacterium]